MTKAEKEIQIALGTTAEYSLQIDYYINVMGQRISCTEAYHVCHKLLTVTFKCYTTCTTDAMKNLRAQKKIKFGQSRLGIRRYAFYKNGCRIYPYR